MLIHRYKVLTISGSQLWTEDEHLDIVQDILEPNGIVLKSSPRIIGGNVALCEVDTENTLLDDFYEWNEVRLADNETFCWRTLYSIESTQGEHSWLSMPCQETIGPYTCKELCDLILYHQSHLNDLSIY